jgi:O-antigen ligase
MSIIGGKLKFEAFVLRGMILAFLLSILSSFLYLRHINNKLSKDFKGIEVVLSSDSLSKSSLVYTYKEKFTSKTIINNSGKFLDTLEFLFPKTNNIVKRFRIDFEKNKNANLFKIKSMRFLFENDKIYFEQEDVFQKLANSSASVILDKHNETIDFNKNIKPFDPYVIFSPLVEFTLNKKHYTFFLLIPFIVLGIITLIYYNEEFKFDLKQLLLFAFIACIPLKIAWTTFFAVLLCIYGTITSIKSKNTQKDWKLASFFIVYFLVLIIVGRPSSISDFDMQLGLFLWALIVLTIKSSKIKTQKYYIVFLMFFHVIITASAISFLLNFNQFYGFQLADFFQNMKLYSRDIRNWLYYDHAAFLSFFGTIGILFLHKLYKQRELKTVTVVIYHLFLISFIFITATRIGFVIYLFIVMNVLASLTTRARLILNTTFFGIFATTLIYNIHNIDPDRAILWNTSWSIIKERPFFGQGLGQSNEALLAAFNSRGNIGLPLLELNHSHNQYLTYVLELGFLGVAILFLSFFLFLLWSKQLKNELFSTYLFAVGLLFLTESALQTSKPLYVLSFLLILVFTKTQAMNR